MRSRAGALLVGLGIAVGIGWLLSEARFEAPIEPGLLAPTFALSDLDGRAVELESLRGRVVLVNFWATWCKPCEDEMPAMERLYQALQSRGFELLAISVDESDEPVLPFRDLHGLTFPILMDVEKAVALEYQSYRYPESFLIGPDGILVERYIGPREWDSPAYVSRIERLLDQG
ncbi:MAG: TlpA family protein disulfide reductase [bacterium]|nr:TlpA family protein disulfide reductase [bacterium]MCP5069914.1 TlpA family protein disulfide reductase [bacterium]